MTIFYCCVQLNIMLKNKKWENWFKHPLTAAIEKRNDIFSIDESFAHETYGDYDDNMLNNHRLKIKICASFIDFLFKLNYMNN